MKIDSMIYFLIIVILSLGCKKKEEEKKPIIQDISIKYFEELLSMEKKKGNRDKAKKLHSQALDEHYKKKYIRSENLWYQAAKIDPSWEDVYYNLGCTTALQGKHKISLSYLDLSLSLSNGNLLKKIEKDKDLISIRKLKEYKKMINKYNKELDFDKTLDLVGDFYAAFGEDNLPKNLPTVCENFQGGYCYYYLKLVETGSITYSVGMAPTNTATGTFYTKGNIFHYHFTETVASTNPDEKPFKINIKGQSKIFYSKGKIHCFEPSLNLGNFSGGFNLVEKICFIAKKSPI